ncbi:MAG: hypothetical protein CMJ78_04360 [Planctomycetaceae bacterium]|nr:hypothetical protein [Planctomycetaceae bacterium]
MRRAYYANSIEGFVNDDPELILGKLTNASEHSVEQTQKDAWLQQIGVLSASLSDSEIAGKLYLEFVIPRMGKRVDTLLLTDQAIILIEFKVGSKDFSRSALDQTVDYALDLKNFHETSHDIVIIPVLVATRADQCDFSLLPTSHDDRLFQLLKSNGKNLREIIKATELNSSGRNIDQGSWESGRYCPTPTIIEAATALYNGHAVTEISRSDAGGEDLHRTTEAINNIIADARVKSYKAACFVTGVPGAGKTLIGLNVATQQFNREKNEYSVFLSGNGPLVRILQEALARDKVAREKAAGRQLRKSDAHSEVKLFIQNVHHYRDECLRDPNPPVDHVALFDEAQRAWNLDQTSKFMRQKKNRPDFDQSEPEFLLSCIDRHKDWGVVICLVGGGQEINTGEAGISEWVKALNRSFPDWHVHISDRLTDSEFGAGEAIEALNGRQDVTFNPGLHLATSMRSYRAENVSRLVKEILDLDLASARSTFSELHNKYPIVLTRDLTKAKNWLQTQARGSERYGIVVSSQASRLKPIGIDVRLKTDPAHWFLGGKHDVRSSYYLEDVSTEFDVQGLELDWVCVTWDADFRFNSGGWLHRRFSGTKWNEIHKAEKQLYLKNAYRVLLTRARQGMIVCVPEGDENDTTRKPAFYDSTFEYLKSIGLPTI